MPGLGGQDLGDGCQPLWEVARPHCSLQSRQLWSPCWGRAVLSLPQGALRVAPGCLLCDLAQRKAWHLCLLGTHGMEHGAVPSLWGAELRTPELFQALPCGPGRGDSTGPSLGPPHCPPPPRPSGGWVGDPGGEQCGSQDPAQPAWDPPVGVCGCTGECALRLAWPALEKAGLSLACSARFWEAPTPSP